MNHRHGYLPEINGHSVYWEETGASSRVPVLALHGGPGTGLKESYRTLFDLNSCRLIGFDQRGAGRSRPLGLTDNNSTEALVDDIERLRSMLGIEKWLIYGGSWGATLGLAYGEAYPERCLGFVLRSIYLARTTDTDWWFAGMRRFAPDAWVSLINALAAATGLSHDESTKEDICGAAAAALDSKEHAYEVALRWRHYEKSCSAATAPKDSDIDDVERLIAAVRIESHYFRYQCFLRENQLIDDIPAVADKPAILIQGERDLVCPPDVAFDLHSAWPGSELVIVPGAGHTLGEPGMAEAIRAANRALIRKVGGSISPSRVSRR